jgi:hypothetical protein
MNAADLELFDGHGNFVLPSDDALAALDPDQRERFEAVKLAADVNGIASERTRAAKQRVSDALASVAEAEKNLRELRPVVTPVEAARAWILSQRRGY